MQRSVYICLITIVILFSTCKESYIPPVISSGNSYLVVEGFINNGADTTWINLSHTFKLTDTANVTPELNAAVSVEGKSGDSRPLTEMGKGAYIAPGLSLNTAQRYRLHIRTNAGKEYASDYVDLKTSPPIDSINWINSDTGFNIYVNTHDPQNASHYYRWEISETWEFHAVYFSKLEFHAADTTVVPRLVNNMYTCWRTNTPSEVLLGSSAKLAQDVIYRFPLIRLDPNTWKIGVRYSLLLKQYVLTPDAYNFWQQLQKNSEQVGSIFSPQPSEARSNIRNLADASELVIGYVSAGTMRQQRIFIMPNQIPGWRLNSYSDACEQFSILNDPDSLWPRLRGNDYLPVDFTPGVTRYWITSRGCADCTVTGVNKKPYFWPE